MTELSNGAELAGTQWHKNENSRPKYTQGRGHDIREAEPHFSASRPRPPRELNIPDTSAEPWTMAEHFRPLVAHSLRQRKHPCSANTKDEHTRCVLQQTTHETLISISILVEEATTAAVRGGSKKKILGGGLAPNHLGDNNG